MVDTRTVFITGSTDGLGRALAHRLAAAGETLILHGRDPARLDRVVDEIRDKYGVTRPHGVIADLSDLKQVRCLAADVLATTDRLDVLVSNAGIGGGEPDGRERRVSADGHELRFAVNYLAGFLLTLELLPLLRESAPARVVNVASIGQHPIDFDDLMIENGYSGMRAYGQSKLAQIGHHIDSLEDGVHATERLVSDTALAGTTGRFFDRTREAAANAQAYDTRARAELWRRSLELVDHPDL